MAHELVLVGGGHAHVQVLRSLALRPLPGAHVTLVVDEPVAVYSGMVPGFVAGQYRRDELEIDVRLLARRAGATVVIARATDVEPGARRIIAAPHAPIPYDTASFDIGSTVAGLDLPGAREFAIATRPIGRFVATIEAAIARAKQADTVRAIVCGAGAGGVELAFALRARLGPAAAITLADAEMRVLSNLAERVADRVATEARARNITLRRGARAASIAASELALESGERIPFDTLIWATGAASQPIFAKSALLVDERGFIRVRPTLEVEGHEGLYAAGDCARFEPDLAKSGVYAVRQGPILDHNLRARVTGAAPRPYQPQRDHLVLLNFGDGTALGTKWGRAAVGAHVFALKDWIDRRFVTRFQIRD